MYPQAHLHSCSHPESGWGHRCKAPSQWGQWKGTTVSIQQLEPHQTWPDPLLHTCCSCTKVMALLIAAKPFGMSANFTPSEGEHIPHRLNMQTSAFGILSVNFCNSSKWFHAFNLPSAWEAEIFWYNVSHCGQHRNTTSLARRAYPAIAVAV